MAPAATYNWLASALDAIFHSLPSFTEKLSVLAGYVGEVRPTLSILYYSVWEINRGDVCAGAIFKVLVERIGFYVWAYV